MSPPFPKPSIRLSHKIKGSNPQSGESTQSSDPAYLQLCPPPLLLLAGEVGAAGPQGAYPKERPTNDRLAVARCPASSLGLNKVPLQTGILLTTAQDEAHDDSGPLAGSRLCAKPATFWVSAAPETTLSLSPLSLWQLE